MPLLILAEIDPWAVIMTIVGLGGLIFFHELGHFIACRLTGTRVEAFSIGFGKEIVGWQRGPTRYRIGIVPLGGYVKMAAENPGEVNTGAPDEFPNKPFGQRLFIMANGVIFNIVLAFILFVVAFRTGVPFSRAELYVVPGGPAWKAGLQTGDLVTHVDGRRVLGFSDLQTEMAFSGENERLILTIERGGKTLEVAVEPEYSEALGLPGIDVQQALGRAALEVADGSPIAMAGGRPGDIVVAIDGRPIEQFLQIRDAVGRAAGSAAAGAESTELTVRVRRTDGSEEDLHVRLPLGERPQLGIRPFEGRRIRALAPGSAFGQLLRRGDDVLAVNSEATRDLGDLRDVAGREPLREIRVLREGKELSLHVPAGLTVRDLAESIAGVPDMRSDRVAVRPGMAAERDGLRTADRVQQVDDKPVKSYTELRNALLDHDGRAVALQVVNADGEERSVTVTPGRFPKTADYFLGYATRAERVPYREKSVWGACGMGLRRTHLFIKQVVMTIRSLLTRRVSAKHIGGPIMLVQVTYNMFDQGWGYYLYILAIISVNLAILNILPIPVLDGGQIVLLCAEKLRGKPLPERFVGYYQMVGLVLILGLLILAFRNDITRLLN
ncbi:MAG: site-2 protease family protein [Planctomycetota bacterium]